MLSTSNRLLRRLSLLQSRRHWTGAELSQRLDIELELGIFVGTGNALGEPVVMAQATPAGTP